MKQLLLILGIILLPINAFAQVGINTGSPRGIFHIDGNGDNTATPTVVQLKNDLIAKVDTKGEMYVNLGSEEHTSSQFGLYDTNKALRLNRVPLTSTTDVTTVSSPVKGLFVYDTNTDYMYYYSGSMWLRIEDEPYASTEIRTNNLLSSASSVAHTPNGVIGGTLLKFTTDGTITAREKGAYGFSFRLYGSPTTFTPTPSIKTYYVYMAKSGSTSVLDCVQLDITQHSGRPVSYTATLSADLEAGDKVCFYWAHNASSTVWTLATAVSGAVNANRASMLYWKF